MTPTLTLHQIDDTLTAERVMLLDAIVAAVVCTQHGCLDCPLGFVGRPLLQTSAVTRRPH